MKTDKSHFSRVIIVRYRQDGDGFLGQIVTNDKSWIRHRESENQRA